MICLLLGLAAASEPDPAPRWTVSVDGLTVALGYPHVLIERGVTPKLSLYAGPHARLFDAPWSEVTEPFVGLGAEFGARWFPWGEAPAGAWVAGRGVVAHLQTTEGPKETAVGGYGSALAGYTWIPWGRLVLSGGLGVQRIHYVVAGMGTDTWFPAAHTAVGVAF